MVHMPPQNPKQGKVRHGTVPDVCGAQPALRRLHPKRCEVGCRVQGFRVKCSVRGFRGLGV